MRLGRPVGDHDPFGRGIDHGDLSLVPEAHIKPVGLLIPGQAVGKGVLAQLDLGLQRPRAIKLRQGMAKRIGNPERIPPLGHGQTCGHSRTLGQLGGILDLMLIREQAPGMVEPIDHVIETPADEQPLAIGRPDQPLKALFQGDPADHLAGNRFERDHLMLAITGMEHGENRLGGMLGDRNRKIPQASPADPPA